jgi:hypothetical protein
MRKFFIFIFLFCFIGLGPINKINAMEKHFDSTSEESEEEGEILFSINENKTKLTKEETNKLSQFIQWCTKNKKERTLQILKLIALAGGVEGLIFVCQFIPHVSYTYEYGKFSLAIIDFVVNILKKTGSETIRSLKQYTNSTTSEL